MTTEKPLDIYVRVSDVKGRSGDSYISPRDQERVCRSMADAKGYAVGEVFKDEDESGRTMDRPQYLAAKQRILDGVSGGIIVAKLDRFARNVENLLREVREIADAGGDLVVVSPTIDTADPAFGKFLLTLFGALAELESNKIGAAWASAKRDMIERGIHGGSTIPAGYYREVVGTKDNGRTKYKGGLLRSEHAEAVIEAFKVRATSGAWRAVADVLNSAGVPTAKHEGGKWGVSATRALIHNRVYLGEARMGEHVRANAHEALVDEVTFTLATRSGVKAAAHDRQPWLLAGLCKCATCGGGLSREHTTQSGKRYHYARCKSNPNCTGGPTIADAKLEEFLVDAVLESLVGVTHKVESRADGTGGAREISDLGRAIEAAQAEVAAFLVNVPATTPGFATALAEKTALVDDAVDALARARAAGTQVRRLVAKTDEEARQVWDAAGKVEGAQKAILSETVERVVVARGRAPIAERVEIVFRAGTVD